MMKRFLTHGLGTAVLLLAFGCAHSNPLPVPGTTSATDRIASSSSPSESISALCAPPTWSYPSNNARWGGTCNTGRSQSPVALVFDPLGNNSPGTVTVKSISVPVTILTNEGFTASVELSPAAVSFTDGADTWLAFEAHFHAPSEHSLTWRGASVFDTQLEIHIKTQLQSDPSQNAVFAVLFMYPANGAETDNPVLQPIFSLLADLASRPVCTKVRYVQPLDLTPIITAFSALSNGYLTYDGSLTTPGCDEGKNWYVLSTPQFVSRAQVAQLRAFVARGMGNLSPLGNNNRAVQLLGSRPVAGFINK